MSEAMEVVPVQTEEVQRTEVSFQEEPGEPEKKDPVDEAPESEVKPSASGIPTPTPMKRKKSVSAQPLKTPEASTSTPSKGQVIATYEEWVKQNKSASKSALKSGSKSASKSAAKSASKAVSKASDSPGRAKAGGALSGKKSKTAGAKPVLAKAKAKSAEASGATPSDKPAKKKSAKLTASKLRRIQELTDREKTEKASLEKLRRAHARLERDLAAREEVKLPVADELIVAVDRKGGRPTPLPEPKNRVNFPPHLVPDLLLVWDFLYMFRKEISLKELELDDFIDVLTYRLDHSPALAETCCALLRTVLADEHVAERLDEELPKELHYSYRGDLVRKPAGADGGSSEQFSQLCPAFALSAQFDSSCAGLKLLNARHPLRTTELDPLKWQAILRAVFPRLDSFRDLQRAADVQGDLAASRYEGEGPDGEGHRTANLDYKSHLLSNDEYVVHPYQSSLELLNSQITAGVSSSGETEAAKSESSAEKLAYTDLCIRAIRALQEKEFFELDLELKLIVLKSLVMTCYDCEAIQTKVANNAEERANQITNNNKLKLEERRRIREASNSMKDIAIERCRAINEKEAIEKEKAAGGSGKKSVQKKLDFKPAGGDKADEPEAEAAGAEEKAAAKKGGKTAKSALDPTPAQLAAMLEEMVMLNSFNIDVVLPAAPELEEVSDNEEDLLDDSTDPETKKLIDALASGRSTRGDKGVTSRSSLKSARDRDRERNQRRADRNATLKSREIASSIIAQAVQSRRERDVKDAIKAAKASGLQGSLDSGEKYVTEELKKVYEVQYQLDTENKEAAQAQKLEKALAELFVRTEPIGQDRYFRSYWCFEGDDRLFVQSERGNADLIKLAVDNGLDVNKVLRDKKVKSVAGSKAGTPSKASSKKQRKADADGDENATEAEVEAVAVASLKENIEKDAVDENPLLRECNRPSRHEYVWSVFRSEAELWQLVEALDERGHRERALKNSIKARFDLQGEAPAPSTYLTEGSPYIGMKVKRTFGKGTDKYVMIGVITGWLPPVKDGSNSEPAYWHVLHADGDDEDLDEREVKKCLLGSIPPKEEEAAAPGEAMEVDDGDESDAVEKKVTRSVTMPKVVSSDDLKSSENVNEKDLQLMPFVLNETEEGADVTSAVLIKNDFYQPAVLRNYSNSYRGGLAFKHHTIGDAGLRTEFLGLMNKMLDGLKARGSQWIRSSTRRTWESGVRDADSAAAFRALLVELENVVRDTQKVEDAKQDEELEKMRLKAQKGLEAEGWVFSKDQLTENSNFAQAVLEALGTANAVGNDISNADNGDSKKRKRDETSEAEATDLSVKKGDLFYPSLPLLKAESDMSISKAKMDAIRMDVEGAEYIGASVRRFFRNEKPSDGTVLAFLPSFLNEGEPLWHLLHDDGDEEDLSLEEVLRGCRAYEKNLDAPEDDHDFDDEGGEEEEANEEGGQSGAEEEEAEADFEEEEGSEDSFDAEEDTNDPSDKRLWPSAYVRSQWCSAISECNTLAEVALGLAILSHQCSEFGVILPDPSTVATKRVSKPVNRAVGSHHAAKKRRFSLTPVKPSKSSSRAARSPAKTNTPSKKKKKSTTRKSMGGSEQSRFNSFGFYARDRPVRGSRRDVCYAE